MTENANAGALITVLNGADMTLQNIRLNGQKNSCNGRAIHVKDGALTILNDTQIDHFKQEASVGSESVSDLKGGAILMEDGTSLTINGGYYRTAVFLNNEIVNDRTEGKTAADGGAIAVGANCSFSITNAQFTGNAATAAAEKKGNGGAISINETREADEALNLQMHNVKFSNNTASYQGGALRTSEKVVLKVDNCSFENNTAKTGDSGAIAALSKADSATQLTVTGGTYTGNKANGGNGGAIKIGGYGTLTLDGNVTMSGNSAVNGGAVTVAPGAQVNMESATIRRNEANEGSAVYVEDYAKLTVTNADVTGNKAKGINGGAINVGGPDAKLYFEGSPTVFDNTLASDTNRQRNVILSEDTNEVINTTENGLINGVIGVYVVGENDSNSAFSKHGLHGMPFGTFGDQDRLHPEVFRNDHALALYGVRNENDAGDTLIYWVDVICKLTDLNDNILYQDIQLTVNGKQETRKAQAVYARITAPDDVTLAGSGLNALRDGFEAAQGTLYVRDESTGTYTFSEFSGTTVKLKMLQDVEIDKSIQAQGTHRIVFTTAETQSTQSMKDQGDYFPFVTGRTEDTGRAHITRGFNDGSMIQDKLPLTLTNILLDGVNRQINANGGIVHVAGNASLTVEADASLVNANTTGSGGAIYVSGSSALTVSGGSINGNSTTADGGAVYAAGNSTVNVNGGTINGNTAANGAGIYLAEDSRMYLSGNPYFGGTGVENENLVVRYANGSVAGNFANWGYTNEAKNGGKTYTKTRQDIYLADQGTTDPLRTLVLTDALTDPDNNARPMPAGSIWVWAGGNAVENSENYHYQSKHQFAMFAANVRDKLQNNNTLNSTILAFRNARDDETAENNTGDYLSGAVYVPDTEHPTYIYWNGTSGSRKVILRKVSANDYTPLSGRSFTVCQGTGTAAYTVKHQDGTTETLTNLTSQSSGVFWIGELPYGTYTIREGNGAVFTLTVGDDTVPGSRDGVVITPVS